VTAGSRPACDGAATAHKGPLSAIGEALGRLPRPTPNGPPLAAVAPALSPAPPGTGTLGADARIRVHIVPPAAAGLLADAPPRRAVKGPWLRAALVRPHQPLDRPPNGRCVWLPSTKPKSRPCRLL
jgi:hypothetical protein